MNTKKTPTIPLPKDWHRHVRSAILHVISLAQFATVYTRSWAVDSMNGRVRLKAERDRLLQELALEREAGRIKDARMARMAALRRPHYLPTERMAILELRAARGWSLQQTAQAFQLTAETIASWSKRVDEEGSYALVQMRVPVNRFPDFVRYVVQQLKVLCPAMGKKKMAEILARAGLHLGTTTVGRMLKEKLAPRPETTRECKAVGRVVTSKYPNHVWLVDLTDPANRPPRLEPRRRWPRGSPCAQPWALVAGKPGDRFNVRVDYHAGWRHLPVVTLKRAS